MQNFTEFTAELDEARMSAALRMANAIDKQRAKSDASLRRTPSSIPKKEEPKKQSVAEAFRPMDTARALAQRGLKEADAGEYDYEGAMAKTQLQTICRNAEALKDMLEDDENLPEWVQAKITKAEDYITTSLDYMKSTDELDEEVHRHNSKKEAQAHFDSLPK